MKLDRGRKKKNKIRNAGRVKKSNPAIVFYHLKDLDGLGSGWTAWRKLKNLKNKAEYIGIDYHCDRYTHYKNKTLYFLDLCPQEKTLAFLRQNHNYLILVDHHLSSQKKLKFFDEYKFDCRRSAAVLSWQYFFPRKKIPQLLSFIEDIDLWKFKLPLSRDINNTLEFYDNNFLANQKNAHSERGATDARFKYWNTLARDMEKSAKIKQYGKIGKIISQYQDKLIQKIAAKAKLVKFGGKKVFAVNSSILVSEVGNALVSQKHPFAIIWSEANQRIWISLRANNAFNVAKIAEKYGGGGHKGAAAFILKIDDPLPWQKI